MHWRFGEAGGLRRALLVAGLAGSVLAALAQTPTNPPPTSTPQNPATSGAAGGQTSTAQDVAQQHKTVDQITRIRQAIENGTPTARTPGLTLDPLPIRQTQVGAPVTFKVLARDASLRSGSTLAYALTGGPEGATIDAQSGVFNWTPTAPGVYTFFVVVRDDNDSSRSVTQPVTIRVSNPLVLFGYSFFAGARALIDYRLAVVRAGLTPGLATPAGNTQAAANLPVVTNGGSPAFGNAGTNPLRPFAAPLAVGAATPNPDAKTTASDSTPVSPNATGTTTAPSNGAQPVTRPSANQEATAPSPTRTPPSGLMAPPGTGYPGDNAPSADALRYFVGPFDMLGLNVFVPAPERYQLGPGDILTVRYWSPAVEETEVDVKVDGRGAVSVPVGGRKVVVRGQTLAQAEALLRHELRRDLRNASMSLSLKALRTMTITVLGDAYLPGSYQVPAVATLFNALYMFGGPSNTGTLRGIQLRRSDGTTRTFDMYRFLVYGDSREDVPLQPGDSIWIPPAGARVTVEGEVLRPGIYEAARGERLREVIAFAGGPRATGVLQRVSLQTVEPSVGRQLRDVDLGASGTPSGDPPVFDGDIATVFSVREQYTNAITLDGAVDQPGQYAATPGATVADLIARARGLLPEAYHGRADLFRRNPDRTLTLAPIDLDRALAREPDANLALRPFDRLVVYTVNDVQWMGDRQVTIRGAAQRPGTYYRADNMRLLDLLLQAGGLRPDAYTREVFVQRMEPNGVVGPLVRLDFARIAANDPTQNLVLRDHDEFIVQTITEANFTPDARVHILGAVQSPGYYARSSNMHLSDLVRLAGGPLPDASDAVEIADARVSYNAPRKKLSLAASLSGSDDPALADGELITIPARSDIELTPRKVVIMGAVKNPGPYAVNGRTDRLSDLIARAGGFIANSYPLGAQFYRDPALLSTPAQDRFTPMIQRALTQVNRESYSRELAKSQIDKARAFRNVNSSTSIGIPGITPSVSDSSAPVPDSIFQGSTVTPARPLTADDLEPGGNINVDLPRALRDVKSRDNLVLQDGDIVVIPQRPTTVSVVGAVTVPSSVLFAPDKGINYYIDRSGGYLADAARDQVLLIRYRGLVVRPVRSTKIEVGDIIWVPTKVIAARLNDRASEIDQISKVVLSGALLFAILHAL